MERTSQPDIDAITIVPTAEEHIEGSHACIGSVALERRYVAFTQPPPLEMSAEFIRNNIARGNPQLVALDGDRVVGWCDINPKTIEGFTHTGVLGMGLHRDYRGRGIGRRLMNEALDWARRVGLERIELSVYASNTPAIELYRKAGFEHEGTRRHARKLDGEYDDIVFMGLLL